MDPSPPKVFRRALLRCMSAVLVVSPAACSGEADPVRGRGVTLRDPAGILDDVVGDLRLLVLPAATYACDAASGLLSPGPAMDPPGAEVPDAVVDITFRPADGATVVLNTGTYSFLVRGRGSDPVTMRSNQVIGTGCATDSIADGETREVLIELKQVVGEGLCGDGILSADEQCEDGNTGAGDGCDAGCRTEPLVISRRIAMEAAGETVPAVGWGPGSRAVVAYDSDSTSRDVTMMFLDESGAIIESPTALSVGVAVDILPGVQTVPSAAAGGGRLGVAYADFSGTSGGGDVRVRFFGGDRLPLGDSVVATADSAGTQSEPALATMSDGTAMVVFEDAGSTTGLSGRLFAAGSTSPSGAAEFEVGTGSSGGAAPALAAHDGGFVVAFAASGDIWVQRFGADGTATDPAALPLLEGADLMGEQSAPSAAALADGHTLIAWQDGNPTADGAGTAVRARLLDANTGTPTTDPFTVDTTTEGDQTAPAAAAGQSRFVVVWVSATELRGRLFDASGNAALNREASPTSDDFVIASGSVSAPGVATGGASGAPRWLVVWQDANTDPLGDVMGRPYALP